MFKDKERIQQAFASGLAKYIKVEGGQHFLVNEDESQKRFIQPRTFEAVRSILEAVPGKRGYFELA